MYRRLDKGDWIKWQQECNKFIQQLRKQNETTKQSNHVDKWQWWITDDDEKKIMKSPDALTDDEWTGKVRPFWD